MAAVKGGSKVVMTSRDYIYRDARRLLKDYAYPLLREHQVVIDVAELTQEERRQILYNHIRLGDQPQEFRTAIKPHLAVAAGQEPFRPEVARRLGSQSFTKGLGTTEFAVQEFMAKPNKFLQDIYEGLEADHVGALAMVYQAGDLPVPLGRPTRQHEDLLLLIGSTYDRVAAALTVLEGTFLRRSRKPGTSDPQEYWVFRHPTLREGFAAFMASNPNWLEIFISGLDDDGVLTQLDCGSDDARGTLVAVPSALYRTVAERVAKARGIERRGDWRRHEERWLAFLANRCSAEFLKLYLEVDQSALEWCLSFGSYMSAISELPVLARLHECGLLSEENHRKIVETISELAVETPDADWINDPSTTRILTEEDHAEILSCVRNELILDMERILGNWRLNEQGNSADDYYYPLEEALKAYIDEFQDDGSVVDSLENALQQVESMRQNSSHWDNSRDAPDPDEPKERASASARIRYSVLNRDVFEDVDE
jgi:hypothetical protein